jgi:hypothetical protein
MLAELGALTVERCAMLTERDFGELLTVLVRPARSGE